MLQDKNRTSCYNFSERQYVCGQKLWFAQEEDSDEGWNQHQPRDRPHDGWQIKISGNTSGQKFGRTATVTLEGYAKDLIEKYRDLKAIVFKGEIGKS